MPSLDHEKVNLQKRIELEHRRSPKEYYERDEPDWPLSPFSKHRGRTLPAIFFIDPGYCVWLCRKLKWDKDRSSRLRDQAIAMGGLIKCILPPAPHRTDKEFAILEDSYGRSRGFIVVKRGQKLRIKRGTDLIEADRVDALDIRLAEDFDDAPHAYNQFGASLRQVFFKDRGMQPTFPGYIKFFANPSNFDPEARRVLAAKGNSRYRR